MSYPRKRSSKKPEREDTNQIAARIIATVTDAAQTTKETISSRVAAELGRRGGLKGGNARAAKLSPKRRKTIARKAARARWRSRTSRPTTPR